MVYHWNSQFGKNKFWSLKDQEIFAFTSSDHAVYLSLFDRITVLSRQNITNTIYNIVTHQPCSHLAIEPVNSLLVASNEMEVCISIKSGRSWVKPDGHLRQSWPLDFQISNWFLPLNSPLVDMETFHFRSFGPLIYLS